MPVDVVLSAPVICGRGGGACIGPRGTVHPGMMIVMAITSTGRGEARIGSRGVIKRLAMLGDGGTS